MRHKMELLILIAAAVTIQGCSHEDSSRKPSETLLDKYGSGSAPIVSTDGRRFAYVRKEPSASSASVIVDGQRGKTYDAVWPPSFSPDSRRITYAAKASSGVVEVVDGKEGKPNNGILAERFSDNSRHLAYVGTIDDSNSLKNFVVTDEIQGKAYDKIDEKTLALSSDGKSAYWACSGDKCFVVADGREGSPYPTYLERKAPVFSPDGRRLAYYVASSLGTESLLVADSRVVNDSHGAPFHPLWQPVFSPDGRRLAFPASVKGKVTVVIDGKEGYLYDGVAEDLQFSPDGSHVVYRVALGRIDKVAGSFVLTPSFVVVDGKGGKRYDGFALNGFAFSPDSQHLAYFALDGNKRVVVIDGEESKAYDEFTHFTQTGENYGGLSDWQNEVVFSPDSHHVAYKAEIGQKWLVVLDGKESRPYDLLGSGVPVFSPDSRHVAYWAFADDKWRVVVDGSEGRPYHSFPTGASIVFDSADRLHYLAEKEDGIYFVEETIK